MWNYRWKIYKFDSDFTKSRRKSGWLKYDLNNVLVPLCNIFVTKWSYLIAPTTSYLLVHHQKVIAEQSRFYTHKIAYLCGDRMVCVRPYFVIFAKRELQKPKTLFVLTFWKKYICMSDFVLNDKCVEFDYVTKY